MMYMVQSVSYAHPEGPSIQLGFDLTPEELDRPVHVHEMFRDSHVYALIGFLQWELGKELELALDKDREDMGDTDGGGIVLEPLCSQLQEVSLTDSNDSKSPKRDYFPYMELPAELKNMLNNVFEQDEAVALSSTCSGLRTLLRPSAFKSIGLVGQYNDLSEKITEVIRLGWPTQAMRSLKIHVIRPPGAIRVIDHIFLMGLGDHIHDLLNPSEASLEDLTLIWEFTTLALRKDTLALFGAFEEKPLCLARLRALRVRSTNRKISDGFFRYLEKATPCLEFVSLTTFTDDTVNAFEMQHYEPNYYDDPDETDQQEQNFKLAETFHEETRTLVIDSLDYDDTTRGVQDMMEAFPGLENLAVHQMPNTRRYDRIIWQMAYDGNNIRKLSLPLFLNTDGSPWCIPGRVAWVQLLRYIFDHLTQLQLFQLIPHEEEAIVWVAKKGDKYSPQIEEPDLNDPDLGGLIIEKVPKADAFKGWDI
ncbi:hypothetical protein CkaCkLH20_03080 [Colletotrichum karsti]|uniref:Uncharacterized protein n=1 Tax=Colletotrichum karsti TaxID=1095194 RepID=A0A9P6I9W2_9PEZI|nr:uncharacterized protein CkaCkLH20_03080 [Colletotrichum karsti]KAF9879537.1 hypothetical protein CkaCkLH20_03080 [Colletotrichum karsti]